MATSFFASLSNEKDFLALDAKRLTVLVELSVQKKALEALSRERPSVRSFERIEARIESGLDNLQTANGAVTSYFRKVGGDPLNDTGFDNYQDTATNITGEIEILRESYHELLKSKGLLVREAKRQTLRINEIYSHSKLLNC